MKLFAELKRRNVIRMAGLYLVGAWLITQVADTILPMFGAPEWVARTIVILLAIGVVPALIFSWLFELTPEGIKRDGEVDPVQSFTAATGRRMDRLLLVGMLAVIGVVAADRYWPRDAAPTEARASVTGAAVVSAAREAGLLAVLPFRNRSVREEDAFFAEGIHDDLLTQLSKVASLRVISRTSMMRYAGSEKSVPEIAREIGAAVVLEGAVQRSGNQVRINMQLIDGGSDEHLWAETYDRELSAETLFAIQADIARAVTQALQVVLTPAEAAALAAGSTRSLPAYEAYLQGKLLSQSDRFSGERLALSLTQFDRAIALDPQFADAYANKAIAQMMGYWYGFGDPATQRDAAAKTLEAAKRLAPDSTETWLAEAYYAYWLELDYARAETVLARVLERSPEYAEAWSARSYVARRDGRFEDSIAAVRHTLQIDPTHLDGMTSLGETLSQIGRFDEAAATLDRARQLGADNRGTRIQAALARGDAEAAWLAVDGPDPQNHHLPFRAALLTRDPERIALALSPTLWPEALRHSVSNPEVYALAEAEALLAAGEQEQARAKLREIQSRLQARDNPYPGGWTANALYFPCYLPGLLGDLDAVHAAERDYAENAPRDVWAEFDVRMALAIALNRAGDADRALTQLEALIKVFGPSDYLRISIQPALDSLHEEPRWIAMKKGYEQWAAKGKS